MNPEAILQLGLGFWGSKALLSAVDLGLFTLLAQGPRTFGRLKTATMHPIVSLGSVVLSFCVSVLIGVFFGAYPASRAAALTPMEALRYE